MQCYDLRQLVFLQSTISSFSSKTLTLNADQQQVKGKPLQKGHRLETFTQKEAQSRKQAKHRRIVTHAEINTKKQEVLLNLEQIRSH